MAKPRRSFLVVLIVLALLLMACDLSDISSQLGKVLDKAVGAIISEIGRILGEILSAIGKFIENLITTLRAAIEKTISNIFPTPSPTSPPTIPIAYGSDSPPESEMYIHVPQGITQLNLREGPGTSYKSIAHLVAGQYYVLLDKTVTWVHISTSLGEGWTSAEYIEITENVQATEVYKPPFEFKSNNWASCNTSKEIGTGEVATDSDLTTGRLVLDVKSRTLNGSATGRSGVGITFVAPKTGKLTIKASAHVAGFDSLIVLDIPKLGNTSIVSLESFVYIAAYRLRPIETLESKQRFAAHITTPDLISVIPSPIDIYNHVYNPPEKHSALLQIQVKKGETLYICVGIESKTVTTGLVPYAGTAKVLYGNMTTVDSIELSMP